MDGTILGQGSFLATYNQANPNPGVASDQAGVAQIIQIPSGADWMKVYNYTKYGVNGLNTIYFNGTANAVAGVEFYWQRGMVPGSGIVTYKPNASAALNADTFVLNGGGFTLYDPSGQSANMGAQPLLGPAIAITSASNATQPVIATAVTTGLAPGTVVRLSRTTSDLVGIDFVVSAVTAGVNFTILAASNALANVPGVVGGAGFYRIVYVDFLFYPRRRIITNITQAAVPVVSTSIAHGMTAGQEIRFNIPNVSGMVQLNPSYPGNITLAPAIITNIIDDYSFNINVNTTGFTAFTYPTAAQQPSSFPIMIPFGEDTSTSLLTAQAQVPSVGGIQIPNTNTQVLADSTVNTGFLGMILGSGGIPTTLATPIVGPAGSVHFNASNVITAQDQMYWVAGKSSYGGQ